MKNITLLLLFGVASAYAQGPQGKLYYSYYNQNFQHYLEYVQYPAGTVHTLDSIPAAGLAVSGATLYAAHNTMPDQFLPKADNIYLYDMAGDILKDSIRVPQPVHLSASDTYLAVTNDSTAPYFRVFDISTRQLLFSLDTTVIDTSGNELLVYGGRAWFITDTSLYVADLNARKLDTVLHFSKMFGEKLRRIFTYKGDLYILSNSEIGQGSSSLFRIDTMSFAVNVLFSRNKTMGTTTWPKPVVFDGKVFLHDYFVYDFAADTITPYYFSQFRRPLQYDSIGKRIFAFGSKSLALYNYGDTAASGELAIAGEIRSALFVSTASTGIPLPEDSRTDLTIAPNPNRGVFRLQGIIPDTEFSLSIADESGREVFQASCEVPGSGIINLDISFLPAGIYILMLKSEDRHYSQKLVILPH